MQANQKMAKQLNSDRLKKIKGKSMIVNDETFRNYLIFLPAYSLVIR